MFPATLFDYNGVLIDDEEVHLAAFREVLGPLGVTVAEDAYWDRYIGFDDAGAFEAILRDSGRSPSASQIANLIDAKKPAYLRRASAGLKTFAGAADLVLRRAGAGPVLVVSGALRSEIELGLEHLRVRNAISAIVSSEDTSRSKPDPEGYVIARSLLSEELGDAATRALVVEDSVAGVQAAKAAGLVCVAVPHSYSIDRLESAGADWVAPSLSSITDEALSALYARAHA